MSSFGLDRSLSSDVIFFPTTKFQFIGQIWLGQKKTKEWDCYLLYVVVTGSSSEKSTKEKKKKCVAMLAKLETLISSF